MYTIEQIKKGLKKYLSEFRYEHSILVAEEARKIAKHYNQNEEKAYIAGLVHDIAKEFSDEENEKWIKKYNLTGDIYSEEYKNVIHSFIGALVIKEWYEMEEEICNAVRNHTIGNISMTELDKIIFVADKIARRVSNPIIEEERKLAYQDINKALELCLKVQEQKLQEKGKKMHPISLELLRLLETNK